jgi:uncharacterized membrane protein YhaH (DUF805 family)
MDKALTNIRYRSDIREAFLKATKLPINFQKQFLKELEKNPSVTAAELLEKIDKEVMQLDRPFDKEFLNRGLISVRPHGDAAEKEYKSTIEMLGDNVNRINVGQITTDIQKKYPFKKEVPERSIKNMNLRQIETTFGKPLRQLMEDYNVKSEAIGNTYCYFIEGSNYVHSTKLDALVEAIEDKEGSQTSSGKTHTVTIENYQEHLNYLVSLIDPNFSNVKSTNTTNDVRTFDKNKKSTIDKETETTVSNINSVATTSARDSLRADVYINGSNGKSSSVNESHSHNRSNGNQDQLHREPQPSGGIGRLAFFLLVFVLAMVGGVAGNAGAEGIEIVGALAVLTAWMFRCKNIGRSPFYALLGLIPIVNLFILGQCLSQPPGYYQHNNMDLIGKFILFLYIGFFVLFGIVILSAL